MSYYTKVKLVSPAAKAVELTSALEALKARLDEMGVDHEFIADITGLLSTGKAMSKVYPQHFWAVAELLSKHHPETRFVLKGKGEDEDAAWTYAWLNGTRTIEKAATKKPLSKEARASLATLERATSATSYSPKGRYSVDEAIEHPTLGKGIVTKVMPGKVVVQFLDEERTLIHART